MIRKVEDSSWIAATEYMPIGEKKGFILVTLRSGEVLTHGPLPFWKYGLLRAAKSTGRAYNKLVRPHRYWKTKDLVEHAPHGS